MLEFIARDADASKVPDKSEKPQMLSISEVGIGVENVLHTVATLSAELAIPNFYDCSNTFASMGSHDGLLIVVDHERAWFPNKVSKPARGPLAVQVETPKRRSSVILGSGISIVSG